MRLNQQQVDKLLEFIKQEPRTINDVAQFLGRSWVTAESYLRQISDNTGLISLKTFRKGSHGALKLVYYNYTDTPAGDSLKEELYKQIRFMRQKQDYNFFEIFQFIPDNNKKLYYMEDFDSLQREPDFAQYLQMAENSMLFYSGNLSFVNMAEKGKPVLEHLESALKRKVAIKFLCRIDVESLPNITKLKPLMARYGNLIELRHTYQPLRGYVVDSKLGRFVDNAQINDYKTGELSKEMLIFFEVYDPEWIAWLQKIFWRMFRTGIDSGQRLEQFEKFL